MIAPFDVFHHGLERRFQRFLRDYINRGRGSVMIEATTFATNAARADFETEVRSFLIKRGLGSSHVQFLETPAEGGGDRSIVMSFMANKVIVPECGDFKHSGDVDWENLPNSSHGCAYQRNLGLSVADPGDFIQAKPFSGRNASGASTSAADANSGTAATATESTESTSGY